MVGISKMTSVFLYKPPNLPSLLGGACGGKESPHLKYHRIYQFWESKCGDLKKDISTSLQTPNPPPQGEVWGGGKISPPLKYHVIYQLWFLMVGISKMKAFLYKALTPSSLSSIRT